MSTVAGVVKEIRAAFRDHDCGEPLVRTVHGVGYAFTGSLEPATAMARRMRALPSFRAFDA